MTLMRARCHSCFVVDRSGSRAQDLVLTSYQYSIFPPNDELVIKIATFLITDESSEMTHQ